MYICTCSQVPVIDRITVPTDLVIFGEDLFITRSDYDTLPVEVLDRVPGSEESRQVTV